MEKKSKSVSIRLNGKEKPYQENVSPPRKNNNEAENYKDEVAASSEPIIENWMDRANELEEDRYFSKKVVDFGPKHQEKKDRSLPFWDDGKRDKSPKLPPYKRKKKGPSRFSLDFLFNTVFLSAVAAIIVGGAFGMMLLNIMAGGPSLVNGYNNGLGTTTNDEGSTPIVQEADKEPLFSIPTLTLEVVQGGAFSTEESGQVAISGFKSNGYPAVLTETEDLRYLFVGIGMTKEEAKLVGEIYENNGEAPYIKTYTIGGNGSEVHEEWVEFLQNGITLMERGASLSSKEIAGKQINNEEVEQFLQAGQTWEASFYDLQEREGESGSLDLAEDWLNKGKPAFEMFISSITSSDVAWEVQGNLLEALMAYEKLIEGLH